MPAFLFLSRLTFWLLTTGCLLTACSRTGNPPAAAAPVPTPIVVNPPLSLPDSLSFLALGDSYTIGQSVPPADRFPVITAELLRAKGFKVKNPEIIARTGWTTAELIQELTARTIPKNFQLVTLLIGVNNQYRRQPLSQYETEFRQLLQLAVQFAAGNPKQVIVLSIPDYSVTPFARSSNRDVIKREIDLFNEKNLSITASSGISYIEITRLSREAAYDRSLLTYDSLHYSRKYYEQVAARVSELAKEKLK